MSQAAQVTIHPSQFPENIQRDLLASFRTRTINHKFLYDSRRQTRKWLELHESLSPARRDPDCAAIYDRCFETISHRVNAPTITLVGLGCGGGRKDTRLLAGLLAAGKSVSYIPVDVSTAMVLTARQAAMSVSPSVQCRPVVCDLATTTDLPRIVDEWTPPEATRLITFFGMIPNFPPGLILPRLAALLRSGEWLLFSANLAPGNDYQAGLQKVLPQYDNALTRDWLMTFLRDFGVGDGDGELAIQIERDPDGESALRIPARFHFTKACQIRVDGERFEFQSGDSIQLFYSYRYTPGLIVELLAGAGIQVLEQHLAASGEEGVFLCNCSRPS